MGFHQGLQSNLSVLFVRIRMRHTLREDLAQLESLGWKTERWVRRETARLAHTRSLRGPLEARGELPGDIDLRWLIDGDHFTQALTAHQRYCLYAVYQAGSARKATIRFALHQGDLEESLNEIARKLRERIYGAGKRRV